MIKSVFNTLAPLDDDFKKAFPSCDMFVKIYDGVATVGESIWNSRRKFYEEEVKRICSSCDCLMKGIPELNIADLGPFVKATKENECDRKLLKVCDSASDLIAAIESDVVAFGCKDVDVCPNKPVPCLCYFSRFQKCEPTLMKCSCCHHNCVSLFGQFLLYLYPVKFR